MANNGRMTRSNAPRVLQLGLDAIIDQEGKDYKGMGDSLFQEVSTEKAYYEFMQMAGTGIATDLGEGEAISYDSMDQHFVFRIPVVNVEKSMRISRNAIKDNLYEAWLPQMARQQLKSLAHTRDIKQANILNRAFTVGVTYGDGSVLCSTSHALQSGGTTSNRLAVDADLSEDSLEAMSILVDGILNDDGLVSQFETQDLWVPTALKFEATRIVKNADRPATADRDINAMYSQGTIKNIRVWKRLTDSDSYFVTTDAEMGLLMVRREGIFTQSSQDPYTFDTILSACERYQPSVGDFRKVVGTPGA